MDIAVLKHADVIIAGVSEAFSDWWTQVHMQGETIYMVMSSPDECERITRYSTEDCYHAFTKMDPKSEEIHLGKAYRVEDAFDLIVRNRKQEYVLAEAYR